MKRYIKPYVELSIADMEETLLLVTSLEIGGDGQEGEEADVREWTDLWDEDNTESSF